MRVAVGGFQHETNTFAASKADFEAFAQADAWPALQDGPPLLSAFTPGQNVPIAGFLDAAPGFGFTLVPLVWCSATPSAHVTEDAFERIVARLLERLAEAMPVDAVYLDLHGAMVTEHLEDGEGEILARVRNLVGPDVPVVASLDLHANVTEKMVAHADQMIAYRTYPHLDMGATGGWVAEALAELLRTGVRPAKALRRLDFLVPIVGQCTMEEPSAGLYALRQRLEEAGSGTLSLSFCFGFPPADIHDCAPTVIAYGPDQAQADRAADALASAIAAAEPAFGIPIFLPAQAVAAAMESNDPKPLVAADAADNPGAGANGDTTGLLRAMVESGAHDAVIGVLWDPQSAAAAHAAGVGAVVALELGGKSHPGDTPLTGSWRVEQLSDGQVRAMGPFYAGATINLGPTARLSRGGVQVVVASRKTQCADRAMLSHIGVDLERQRLIAVKSSVHFRADFNPLAARIVVVDAPGPNPADNSRLPYRRLAPGRRLMPGGPAFSPDATIGQSDRL